MCAKGVAAQLTKEIITRNQCLSQRNVFALHLLVKQKKSGKSDTSLAGFLTHAVFIGLDWTRLVKLGIIKHALVKHRLVNLALVKHTLVSRGLVKRGLVERELGTC